MKDRPPPKDRAENWKLKALSLLESMSAREVAHELDMPETTFNYHLKKWRVLDVIRRVGYGVWEVNHDRKYLVLKHNKKVVKAKKELRTLDPCRSTREGGVENKKFVVVQPSGSKSNIVQDSVASHGFMFVLSIPQLARWHKAGRRKYLVSRDICFVSIQQGERLDPSLTFGWKVHLTGKSVVAYAPRGVRWFAASAAAGFRAAFNDYLSVVKRVESLLGVSLSFSGRYRVKTSREHHALVANALAEQYTRSGNKLFVRDVRGLWALIDASVDPGEFETVRAGADGRDANRRVQDFFNGVKDTGVTPQGLLDMIHGLSVNAEEFGRHMKTHVAVMKEIRDFIREFRELRK